MTDPLAQFVHLRNRSVMILTPIYRESAQVYNQSLLATAMAFQRLGIRFGVKQVVGDAHLARGRNQLVASFLASGVEDALFIDADMEWQPEDALRLLASEQLLIGGPYRRRLDIPENDPLSWCIRFLPKDEKIRQDVDGAIEVEGAGTGFLRIDREVFERLIAAHPDWKRPGSEFMSAEERAHYYRFFRFPEEEEWGEDYFFCRSWRELGGTVWLDPKTSIGHVGTQVYRGSLATHLFRRVPSAEPRPKPVAEPIGAS